MAERAKTWGRRAAAQVTAIGPVRRGLRALAGRGRLPQAVYQRLPPGVETFEVAFADGTGFVYEIDPQDPFVRQLFWRGVDTPEGASLVPFHDLARGAELVLDVGAHTGLYTLAALAADPAVEVVAFEPVPANAAALARNLERNKWTHRCEVRREAVTDHSGVITMHVPLGDHPMSASLETSGFRGQVGDLQEVPCIKVDDFLGGRRPSLVKVDVEGFEHLVLEGMTETLDRWRPPIMVECNPDGPITEIERILGGRGYRFRHLRNDRPSTVRDRLEPDPTETYRNFLCEPA